MARGGKPIPTVAIEGPKGRLVINQCDLSVWRAKGYRLEGEAVPEPQGDGNEDPANPEEPSQEYERIELETWTVHELRAEAQRVGLSEVKGIPVGQMKKSDLVEALRAVGS